MAEVVLLCEERQPGDQLRQTAALYGWSACRAPHQLGLQAEAAVARRLRRYRPPQGDDGVGGPQGVSSSGSFMEHRVLPLQGRPHLISQMSGRRDPCWLSTKEMSASEVARLVNYISNCKLSPVQTRRPR